MRASENDLNGRFHAAMATQREARQAIFFEATLVGVNKKDMRLLRAEALTGKTKYKGV